MATDTDVNTSGGSAFTQEKSQIGLKRERKERRTRRMLAGGLGVALAAVGTGAGIYLTSPAPKPPKVWQPPCLACVSDGSRVFPGDDQAMRAVLAAIAKENAAVRARKGHPYVSIMVLNPMTPGVGSDLTPTRMVDELRGAYLAQLTMDATGTLGIQLLLDDEGTSAEADEGPAVQQLKTMEGAPDHVVAVAGNGVSNAQSAAAGGTLARNGMPIFGGLTAADAFNGNTFNGMIQVVPDVSEEVAELANWLPTPRTAVLVYDQEATDYYTSDLRTNFTQDYAKSLTDEAQPYMPGVSDTNVEFEAIADEVCYTSGRPPVVLYAGRDAVLAALVQQFQDDGNCHGKKITMVTGGDGDGLDAAVTASPSGTGQVSVIYTGLVNLNNLTSTFKQSYQQELGKLDPGSTGMSDEWMAGTYNAMMAAWAAIQPAYEASAPAIPTKSDVLGFVVRLNGMFTPSGAAGPFPLSADGEITSPDIPIFEDTGGQRITLSN
jgi:hypothetical protein